MRYVKLFVMSVVLMVSTAAQAGPLIDFIGAAGGTLTVTPPDKIGTDINISYLQFIDTPNEGQFEVQNGLLNFSTVTDTFEITGAVADLGIGQQTLLSGTLGFFGLTQLGPFLSFQGSGWDWKSPELIAAAGLPPFVTFQFATIGLATQASGQPGVYDVFSTDVGNIPTPEPASVLLLGSGLLAVGLLRRKRAV